GTKKIRRPREILIFALSADADAPRTESLKWSFANRWFRRALLWKWFECAHSRADLQGNRVQGSWPNAWTAAIGRGRRVWIKIKPRLRHTRTEGLKSDEESIRYAHRVFYRVA